VRPSDRLLPGAQAPDGRPAGPGRDVAVGLLGGVVRTRDRRAERRAARPRREVLLLRRAEPGRRRDGAAARRHRDHLGARRAAGVQAGSCAGAAVRAAAPASRAPRALTLATLPVMSRIFTASFASVYPLYLAKVEKKGRTKAELDGVIEW